MGVLGSGGRMGQEVTRAVGEAPDFSLVSAIGRGDPLTTLTASGVEAAVDFTHPDVVMDNLRFCIERGIHAVVGTTGFDEDRLARLREWLTASPGTGVLIAPNFSPGAALMVRFAVVAARHFESVEIVDLHHADKVDAPSGTATRTAELIAESRRAAGLPEMPDRTSHGQRQARGVDVEGVRVHSLRMRGALGHTEVALGSPGELLTIRHDSLDRASFIPGVLAGLRAIRGHPGLTVGLENVL